MPERLYLHTVTEAKKHEKSSAEAIAEMADRGENISRFFTNKGKMMPPIECVNVEFTEPILKELDAEARELNISRQAVTKTRHALDQKN